MDSSVGDRTLLPGTKNVKPRNSACHPAGETLRLHGRDLPARTLHVCAAESLPPYRCREETLLAAADGRLYLRRTSWRGRLGSRQRKGEKTRVRPIGQLGALLWFLRTFDDGPHPAVAKLLRRFWRDLPRPAGNCPRPPASAAVYQVTLGGAAGDRILEVVPTSPTGSGTFAWVLRSASGTVLLRAPDGPWAAAPECLCAGLAWLNAPASAADCLRAAEALTRAEDEPPPPPAGKSPTPAGLARAERHLAAVRGGIERIPERERRSPWFRVQQTAEANALAAVVALQKEAGKEVTQ